MRAIYDQRMGRCSTLYCLERVLQECYEICERDDECERICDELYEEHARRLE